MPIPENNVRFTDLSNGTVKAGSIFATSEPDSSTPPSYDSTKVTAQEVGNFVATSQTYSGLSTVAKTLVGAINEAAQGGGGGSSTLAGLSDVSIVNPQRGDILRLNNSDKWANAKYAPSEVYEVIDDPFGEGDLVLDIDISYLALRLQNPDKGNIYIKTLCSDNVNYDYFPYFGEMISSGNDKMFFAAVQEENGHPVLKLATATEWSFNSDYTQIVWSTIPLEPVEVSGTLTAGSTSLTLSDAAITTSSTIDIYTDTYGVNPTAVTVSTGSVTMTFEAQQSNVSVKVRVS